MPPLTPSDHLSRRDFLTWCSVSGLALATGCAVNPVTGRRELMLLSETEEVAIDQQHAPHQISADFGVVQDPQLGRYIASVGQDLAARTQRPHVPYSFHTLNAVYINAYAFPGGTIGITRGILLKMENEAELAALLGHELGHVNARHTAQRMSQSAMAGILVSGVGAIVPGERASAVVTGLGGVGVGALLARYSRDQERQADALALDYMLLAEYHPDGLVGLMNMLQNLSQHRTGMVEMLFSTHPMSTERHQTAVRQVQQLGNQQHRTRHRERYMDATAGLRANRQAIEALQRGEQALAQKKYHEAQTFYKEALTLMPNDYAANLMMAKCYLMTEDTSEASRYANRAKALYPEEAQAHHLSGFINLRQKSFAAAHADFSRYEELLSGNPNTIFFKGFSLENMQQRDAAAAEYKRFLGQVREGDLAQHAYRRLKEWGYI